MKNNDMKKIKQGSVCIHFLDFLLRYAREQGLETKSVISSVNLDPDIFEDPDSRVPAAAFIQVWSHIAGACRDQNFGLHLGSNLTHFPFSHIVFSVMLNEKGLLSALKSMIRYHNLMSDFIQPHLFVNDENVVFSFEKQGNGFPESRQYFEFIFAMILSFLRYLSSQKIDPDVLRFSHEKPADSSQQIQFFKSELIFGAKMNEMVFQKSLFDVKINLANPDLLPILELNAELKLNKFNDNDPWSQKVETIINLAMNSGPLTIDSIAKTLAVSKRTLQNRLKEEGHTFRGIYETKRKKKAIALLKNLDISMVEIAFLLGFSEQSAFNHAFKKWTGQPPGWYRISLTRH